MSTIWFPAPVVLFFRRLFNAACTLSAISRQYQYPSQLQPSLLSAEGGGNGMPDSEKILLWDSIRYIGWPSWLEGGAFWRVALSDGLPNSRESDSLDQPSKPPSNDTRYSLHSQAQDKRRDDVIHQLMSNPVLYDPLRKPRYPIVLCHGMSRPPFWHMLFLV